MKTIRILNLGAGVQSTTIALMIHRGEIPSIDCAIFADTQEESRATYDHLAWLTKEVATSFPIHVVTQGKLGEDIQFGRESKGESFASIPAFMAADKKNTDGIIRRQCTSEYKLKPIDRFIRRELIGVKDRQHMPKDVSITQIFGLSFDEPGRISRVRANIISEGKVPSFPLFDKVMSRRDCVMWLEDYGIPHSVPRSACVFCPYKDNTEWLKLKETDSEGWDRAIEIDEALRNPDCIMVKGLRKTVYLHRSCVPLAEADLRSHDERRGQLMINFAGECAGMCGV